MINNENKIKNYPFHHPTIPVVQSPIIEKYAAYKKPYGEHTNIMTCHGRYPCYVGECLQFELW